MTLARRYSGGGAVYQDLGSTTFTFAHEVGPHSSVTKLVDDNFNMLVDALKSLGIPAARKGRNDLVVGESKVSGSAFKQTANRFVHHGTILVNTDMSNLGRFLTPSKLKLKSKGISSVSARVSNLSDTVSSVDHEKVCDSLTRIFRKNYACESSDPAILVDEVIQTDPVFVRHHERLRDWQWRYGSTPEFSNTIETRLDGIGIFECHYEVEKQKIKGIKIFSDILVAEIVDDLEAVLRDIVFNPASIRSALNDLAANKTNQQEKDIVGRFADWIIYDMF